MRRGEGFFDRDIKEAGLRGDHLVGFKGEA